MARAEKLPKGFWRSPSGSLRVQLRVKGHKMESKSFPLFADTPFERRRQREDAEAWALDTRRRMRGGTHVSTRDAAKLTLADALKRYERGKLDPDNSNHRKDINRIKAMLSDAIAQRSVASLRPTDVAAYRDDLVRRGWMASVAAALRRAEGQGASKGRLGEIAGLERLRSLAEAEERSLERRALAKRREAIEAREGIASPARTTVSNKTQLITRALGYLAETVDGVPDLSGTPMPSATPGRERRLRVGEEDVILARARSVNSYLELGIRLAIDTTLRRERVLELSPRHLVDIGGGRSVIMFPREGGRRRKRVGIVPVTPEIRAMLQEAAVLSGHSSIAECDPDTPFLSDQREHVRSPLARRRPRLRHRGPSLPRSAARRNVETVRAGSDDGGGDERHRS